MAQIGTKQREFDVCVVGTGAGGGVMIDQLTAAGLEVVALERGRELSDEDLFNRDELQCVVRDSLYSPHQLETYRREVGAPVETGRISELAHCVGGTFLTWAGVAWRFRPDDFRVLSTDGPLAGANLADWPVSYEEMVPFYEIAERDFGVAGGSGGPRPGVPGRSLPLPAHPQRVSSQRFVDGARKLGYRPFPVPIAVNSRRYEGRLGCRYRGACRGYGCPIAARASSVSVSLPRALATGRLDLRADAMVFELPVNEKGLVTGARYLDAAGNAHEVKARHTIVAGGAIGSPHLLLMSKSAKFPHGLANGSGLVGRLLQYHVHPTAVGVFDEDMRNYTGMEYHSVLDDLYASDPKRGFIRGGAIVEVNTISSQPIAYTAVISNSLQFGGRWGAGLKERIRAFPHVMTLTIIGEEMPMDSNTVDLDPDVKDRFGLPVPRITKRNHPNDIAMYNWFEKKLVEIVEAAGARHAWPGRVPGVHIAPEISMKGSAHVHGTVRMGKDPAKSVVDATCRSHEVRNLWVVDSSVMPTNGGYNPTLTILANAYRVAGHLVREAGRNAA